MGSREKIRFKNKGDDWFILVYLKVFKNICLKGVYFKLWKLGFSVG